MTYQTRSKPVSLSPETADRIKAALDRYDAARNETHVVVRVPLSRVDDIRAIADSFCDEAQAHRLSASSH